MNLVKKILRRTRQPSGTSLADPLQSHVFSFTRSDGSFDYEGYKNAQVEGNKAKITKVFADERTLQFVADYLRRNTRTLRNGICHGTRRGVEQRWLAEFTGAKVIGTEISDTADQFESTVEWDFHEQKPEWISAFDFVYSNSHDHSYDPSKSISTWVEQLAPGGCVVLEHTDAHHRAGSRAMDPWGVRAEIIPFLIAKWSSGKFSVTEVLEPSFAKPDGSKVYLLIIRPCAKSNSS
ncbi:hypothetical protein [Pelagibacterium montanilacus]|uniref:hypothetical protein n=1 Tax=Pelagibacterium montanilacus TaxID=2185280 RepID=UPI000F8D1389|nr:hypothetical protein [Pelagibacterium montanilacus]